MLIVGCVVVAFVVLVAAMYVVAIRLDRLRD